MLTDFERKLAQIIRNDQAMGRITDLDDLEQRTGHEPDEIETAITKLKTISRLDGGLKR